MDEAHEEMQSSSSRQRQEDEGANKASSSSVRPSCWLLVLGLREGGVKWSEATRAH